MIHPKLTIRKVAELLAVTPGTVRRWIRSGRVRAVRTPGGPWRIDPADVAALRSGVAE